MRSIYKVQEIFQIKSVDFFVKFKQIKYLEEQSLVFEFIFIIVWTTKNRNKVFWIIKNKIK